MTSKSAVDNDAAGYSWPHSPPTGPIPVRLVGSGRPLVAVGLLPHANEPLGSAFVSTVDRYGAAGSVALVGPIDPPPAEHRFPLPCDPVTYAAHGYLQPLAEQVEFAHCAVPRTPAAHRAARLRDRLRQLDPDVLVLLHNDVGARAPYLYANRPWPRVEHRLVTELADAFPRWPRLAAGWTHALSRHTYAYFPAARIGVAGSEAAGLYIERELGIPVLTVELPMFDWGTAESARTAVHRAFGEWIARGASLGGDTRRLAREVASAVGEHRIGMVPAEVNARVVESVVRALNDVLAASSVPNPPVPGRTGLSAGPG